ncbi:hypothetical protein ES319_D11G214100v1 [Gossypium barbadense]|uniref:Kinesin motor domain-containing protein n=1 Tax=Gossypium barbadense TaxID=3634 RepID=A0A5J5PE34_GOSBA|nr:hypothetical protein ES319_D11G214100v1 [Gossypium barbadense]
MEAAENCSVKVAVHIRPFIGDERTQGCKECVTVTPGKPQVQIGTHSFTFDQVYGNGGSPSSSMFEECVGPLVDGLFQGYNATVLAYGQTGSGKTYTMGTATKDDCQTGLIPQVMNELFKKIETLKRRTEFQLHVSFIEILREEVRDLLNSEPVGKLVTPKRNAVKTAVPGRLPLQIRESSNGIITLAGSTEVAVSTLQEMATCLEHGSISRSTGSTNMNNQSSRSHAIFTITLEQMHKTQSISTVNNTTDEDMSEEYLCAKLHLVDLAGSERAKRTGSDGLRLKAGIHINRGLLALGNVISALGNEKKRKEGMHVPYRDSKLTRLLQDSLGGNSKTVMIACISPADINAEESLNTLKYANRARNIQNKPVVNRDLISTEMQKMCQQLQYLRAELCARVGGPTSDIQVLKERITWLEATNEDLRRELHEYCSRRAVLECRESGAQDGHACFMKSDVHKRAFQSMDSSYCQMDEVVSDEKPGEIDVAAKELEHALRQNTMDRELNELNKHLEQKESEMKLVGGADTEALKQHFQKKIMELEEEKRIEQHDRDRLLAAFENRAANSDAQRQKRQEINVQKIKALEAQISDVKKKQENQVELLKQKKRSDAAAKRLQAEIQYIKAQKVQLQRKIKQEAEQFRQWKASREKELLQLRKEGRRNEYERHKLEALNQCQKLVLQRKTEEATIATKRLKELLEAHKCSVRDNSVNHNGHSPNGQSNEKSLRRWVDHELEVMVKVREVRFEYEKQIQVQSALAEELTLLKEVDQFSLNGDIPHRVNNGHSRLLSMSPNARMERIASLEYMLSMSSNALKAMVSQLSDAEEQECGLVGRRQWNQVHSLSEAKSLLQYLFNATAESRSQLRENDLEIKDLKQQLKDLTALLWKSEAEKKELVKEQKMREQAVVIALATSATGNSRSSSKHLADVLSPSLSPTSLPVPKQLKFTPGIVNGSITDTAAFLDQRRKMVPVEHLSIQKVTAMGQTGKLWRWKRSHHQWLLQFRWKWQKPWKLSEWIKHSDETIMRSRPHAQALIELI